MTAEHGNAARASPRPADIDAQMYWFGHDVRVLRDIVVCLYRLPAGGHMGSRGRGRSIRLRIYFLVAIPLITMLGLFGYAAYTSIINFMNLDRAPSLIKATSVPLTNFVSLLQAERRAAVVYLSQPDGTNLAAYQTAITATKNGEQPLEAALTSAGTKD